ncbi:putative GMC oxidoreductase [Daldinia eschscholtzii]|nr:putative GMC oxidoreductase [Daldinia eschscholtzii]
MKLAVTFALFAMTISAMEASAEIDITVPRLSKQNNYPPSGSHLLAMPPENKPYEYVIVSSGAGGSPLAARLALAIVTKQDRKLTYLTPDGDYYSGVNPPESSKVLGNHYPRVGALGGCTQHLALVPVAPARNGWDDIKNLTRDQNWDVDCMQDYFKIEKNQYLSPEHDTTKAHGFNGWLSTTIEPLDLYTRDLNFFLEYDINNNLPDRDSTSVFSRVPLSISTPEWKRAAPRNWFYDIATAKNVDGFKKHRLDIALHTLVTKVNFDTTGGKPKATGVDYLYGESLCRADPRSSPTGNAGTPGSVSATREVIISGGAFDAPQILKLSGIGPAEELKNFGIPVIKDLPGVGGNLQDRYEVSVTVSSSSNFTLFHNCTFITTDDDPCYEAWGRPSPDPLAHGSYATDGIAMAMFLRSSTAGPDQDLWVSGAPGLYQGYFPGMSSTVVTPAEKDYFTWLAQRCRFGEGDQSRAVDAEKDPQAVVDGMRLAIQVFDTLEPLETDQSFKRVWPPAKIRLEEDLKQWARDEAWGHHASCTCPIGADGDPFAVLVGQFCVRGVDGLRVVDASAFPKTPELFPVVGIYMLAEKAVDDILEDAR